MSEVKLIDRVILVARRRHRKTALGDATSLDAAGASPVRRSGRGVISSRPTGLVSRFFSGIYRSLSAHRPTWKSQRVTQQPNLLGVDWSKIPAPADDGAMAHLTGTRLPSVALPTTAGTVVTLADIPGRAVVFGYPMTGQPGVALPGGWDDIPGARGCTPQSCAFRDHHAELIAAGASATFGLSTQDTAYQREAAVRLHLPFPLLSDEALALTKAARLPTMEVHGRMLLKRFALVLDDGVVTHVFYPVFPPDRNAGDVLAWLVGNPKGAF